MGLKKDPARLEPHSIHQFLNISLAQASSDKNITPVCTTLSVCISIEQSRGSPESKECLGIDIQRPPKVKNIVMIS